MKKEFILDRIKTSIIIFLFLVCPFAFSQHGICPYGWLYLDNDGDGFGSNFDFENKICPPSQMSSYVYQGLTYVSNNLDCNDDDPQINPNTIWYVDLDHDGFGSSLSGVFVGCYIFNNTISYVLNNDDCDDFNSALNPNTLWYIDLDHDGYGNGTSTPITQCQQPQGWYSYIIDCDDSNSQINIPKVWAIDQDGDGFGEINPTGLQCYPPSGANYVGNFSDECPGVYGTISGCITLNNTTTSFENSNNYILKYLPKVPVVNLQQINNDSDVTVQIDYFDGLGRPNQKTVHKQSSSGKDIITHIEYDEIGRIKKDFLPFASQNSNLNFNSNAAIEVLNYYNTPYYDNTSNPFSEKLFESSLFEKVIKQSAPGNDWKLGSNHEIKFTYNFNIANEVKLYKVDVILDVSTNVFNPNLINSSGTVYYPANELYKTITFDENSSGGNSYIGRTEEFKDKEGKVILKRNYNATIPHDTYYVYDKFGNLTYVIPPAVSGTINTPQLDNLCYQYKYDYRNRLVEKKLPGKQWEYIVYDKLDRVVATGPAYTPWGGDDTNKGWMITKYDVFNRPLYTGWYNGVAVASSADRFTMQNNYTTATVFSESKATADVTIDGVITKYSNTVFPTSLKLLTVTYYDNYDYPDAPIVPTQIEGQNTTTTAGLKGLPTGSWVRVLDDSNSTTNETSYTVYDTRLRPIRVFTKNYLGGYTQVDTKLDWAGKTLYTITKHIRTTADVLCTIKDRFEYSPQDRVTKHVQQILTPTLLPEQLLALNEYDELGQLKSKKVGGTDVTGAQALQTVDYTYNIRGWLKSINDVTNLGRDLFAFKINYNDYVSLGSSDSPSVPLFNGNIAATYWKSSSDNVLRKYQYTYDDLNRLTFANYKKPELATSMNNYLEHITYDANGNIQTLKRTGNFDPNGDTVLNEIDQLSYTYDTDNKNLLLKVDDASNSPQGFKDNYASTGNDYSYDANGNMIADQNKDIHGIIYNHLNLPVQITFSGTTNGTISYLYNALGQKVKKMVNNGVSVNTDYLSGFQYQNEVLDFFPHAEGYVKATEMMVFMGGRSYGFNYVFNYTDHLGNIRLSYSKDPSTQVLKIIEETVRFIEHQ